MDKTLMEPFVAETINTFKIMFDISLEERDLESKESPDGTYDMSAMVGISGTGTGAVVLSFPEAVARKIVSKMLGEEMTELDQDVSDGIGEIVNIVSGNAKRGLVKHGFQKLMLSLPHVVIGKHRTVWRSKDMPCLMKRFFHSDLGTFCIEVNLRSS